MLEIHRHKTVNDGTGERKIKLFQDEDDIVLGMNICLESIATIRRLLKGLSVDAFLGRQSIIDQCAVNYMVIGNQMAMLDDSLKSNRAMETAYGARNMIAHWYRTPAYNNGTLWKDLIEDLDYLEDGCKAIIEKINAKEIVMVENRRHKRRGLFGY